MKKKDIKILLVDDEPDILEIVGYNLSAEGYEVFTAKNGIEGVAKAKKKKPHLIILDVMMPEMDGIEACEIIRRTEGLEDTLITFLTARGEDYSQMAGFDAGADDYITKPIKPKVLVSKVKALLRRLKNEEQEVEDIFKVGEITINREEYKIVNQGAEIILPRKEFELLALLTSKPNKVFKREVILDKVWGNEVVVGGRTIDVHIRKLREKIGDDHFKTVKGVGYRFALRTTILISFLLTAVLGIFLWNSGSMDWGLLVVILVTSSFISFLVVQLRIEKFIYRNIERIYNDVSLLESTSLAPKTITTDMRTLTDEIEKFAKDKKIEIDTLKIREEYRKDFLGNVSHELKTPLFTVQGYILTLLDGAMDDKNLRKKYLQRANKGVERLIYIVKDLDLITKLEVGDLNLKLEDFDILELVRNVFELLEMKAAKKNITLTFDMDYKNPIYVKADKEKIQQVITNLVVNSIKYGQQNGTTEVSVENLIKNKVIIRVTDNGEGISKQHLARIFERFYRVDKSGSRAEGGSGLGLAIVKHIIEAHNEKIYVESVLDIGSEFSFTLEKATK